MPQPICPHVGAVDTEGNRSDAAAYPSFENRCFVVHLIDPMADGLESREQLLLRDQATYCLGESHRLCPRYRLLHPGEAGTMGEGSPIAAGFGNEQFFDEGDSDPPRWGMWAGLGSLLLVFLLCGGSLAAYAGWQLVGRGVASLSQRVESSPASSEPGQVIILVTSTPLPVTPAAGGAPGVVLTPTPTSTSTFAFPQAVTATPADSGQVGPLVITTPTPQSQADADPLAPELATAVAGALVITQPGDGPPTPTRRATPVFVVPTSTPGNPVVAGVEVTATPNLLPAKISFRSAHQSVLPGACTILYWEVENVRAVFLDGQGVAGRGEREVCLLHTSQSYILSVLKQDGSQETQTVTVILVPHTVTPTITPTNTPVLTPTPTWTPQGTPVATAAPPTYGVSLTPDGGNQKQCSVGQRCEVSLLVENTGSLADEIFLNLGKNGPWNASICRDDGNCADTSLSVAIGPADRRFVVLRVDIPGDAADQSYTFQLEAQSGNSGRTVSSGQVSVTLRAQ